MKVIYQGLFLDQASVLMLRSRTAGLTVQVNDPHVTFAFHPTELFPSELIGQEYTVRVTYYGNDGHNEGYLVEIPEQLRPYYKNPSVPHITVSLSRKGRAVDTGMLLFKSIEPFDLTGRMGLYAGRVIFSS